MSNGQRYSFWNFILEYLNMQQINEYKNSLAVIVGSRMCYFDREIAAQIWPCFKKTSSSARLTPQRGHLHNLKPPESSDFTLSQSALGKINPLRRHRFQHHGSISHRVEKVRSPAGQPTLPLFPFLFFQR